MIVFDRVSKWFGDVVAVSDVSFTIAPGVTALLGPNGAGKSTVLRMMSGLTSPSQGTVRIFGRDPRRDEALTRLLGLVPQQEGTFAHLDARAFVRLAATLHGLPDADAAAVAALALVELDPALDRPLGTYSKGMAQRVKIAQALVHDPPVLLLDEPLTGCDPRQRQHLVGLVRDLGESGRTVVVSSHVLDEVERFGSRVLMVAQGRLAATGDFREIRALMDDRPHRLRLTSADARALAARLVDHAGVDGVHLDGPDTVLVDTLDVERFRRSIAVVARDHGLDLREVVPLDDDLESVFLYLVGRGR